MSPMADLLPTEKRTAPAAPTTLSSVFGTTETPPPQQGVGVTFPEVPELVPADPNQTTSERIAGLGFTPLPTPSRGKVQNEANLEAAKDRFRRRGVGAEDLSRSGAMQQGMLALADLFNASRNRRNPGGFQGGVDAGRNLSEYGLEIIEGEAKAFDLATTEYLKNALEIERQADLVEIENTKLENQLRVKDFEQRVSLFQEQLQEAVKYADDLSKSQLQYAQRHFSIAQALISSGNYDAGINYLKQQGLVDEDLQVTFTPQNRFRKGLSRSGVFTARDQNRMRQIQEIETKLLDTEEYPEGDSTRNELIQQRDKLESQLSPEAQEYRAQQQIFDQDSQEALSMFMDRFRAQDFSELSQMIMESGMAENESDASTMAWTMVEREFLPATSQLQAESATPTQTLDIYQRTATVEMTRYMSALVGAGFPPQQAYDLMFRRHGHHIVSRYMALQAQALESGDQAQAGTYYELAKQFLADTAPQGVKAMDDDFLMGYGFGYVPRRRQNQPRSQDQPRRRNGGASGSWEEPATDAGANASSSQQRQSSSGTAMPVESDTSAAAEAYRRRQQPPAQSQRQDSTATGRWQRPVAVKDIPDVEPSLLDAVRFVESSDGVNLVSPKGALGPYQIMPATAEDPGYGVRPIADPMDEVESRRFANDYLKAMLHRYNGDLRRALVAYNLGPGHADKWDGRLESLNPETRQYLPKVMNRLAQS